MASGRFVSRHDGEKWQMHATRVRSRQASQRIVNSFSAASRPKLNFSHLINSGDFWSVDRCLKNLDRFLEGKA